MIIRDRPMKVTDPNKTIL